MAVSYVLPQVRVFQEFARTPNDVTQSLNPFIIGPNYQLMRYSDKDERDDCTRAAYVTGESKKLRWAAGYANSTPDTSWGGVTMANAYVALGDEISAASVAAIGAVDSKATKFEFNLGGGSLIGNTPYFGVVAKVGDYVGYKSGSNWVFRRIREISCGKLASGEITSKVTKKADGSDVTSQFTVTTSGYTGEKSASIELTIAEDKKPRWKSTVSGLSGASTTALANNTDLTLGLGLKIKMANVVAGTYVVTVTLKEPYARDTVTLSDYAPINTAFTIVRHVDSADVDETGLTRGDDGITVDADVQVDIGLYKKFKVISGDAYLNQRNFRTDHADAVYTLGSDADVLRELGPYDTPDNPLAYAAHIMLLNSARKRIRYIGLDSDDAAGYAKALERASVTTEVYAFCPLTEDADILNSVVADCNRLSEPEEKSWRIAIFSKPTEESADITPNVYGMPETCKVSSKTLTCYSGNTGTESSVAKFTDTVRPGDIVTVVTTTGVAVETSVDAVVTDTRLTLVDAVPNASSNCRFSIVHRRSPAEYVNAIAATSEAFRDRRAYNVFPNRLRASDGNYVSGMYAAAAVCALACSVPPQQPITNVEIKGFSDIPDTYSKFSRDELNTIAGGGTLIVMQDKVGGPIYVRHQISTAYQDGNLNSTELSMVKNLDSISYYFANRFAPYTGRYNISDDLLVELRGILDDGLAHLETTTETNKLIGPQVIAEGTEVRALYRDPSEKDKAYANVALNLPAPFNNFDLHLQVI